MSFIPAGEEDNFDSDEDGFVMDGDLNQIQTSDLSSEVPSVCTAPQTGADKTVTWARSTREHWPHAKQTPTSKPETFCSQFYTKEDYKVAATKGNKELCKKCLDQGIPIDQPLRGGWTALMYAANYAWPELVTFLLNNGADPQFEADMYSVLMCACAATVGKEESIEECVRILAEAGVGLDTKNRYHSTPLMLACKEGHSLAVKQLIQRGVEVNKQDSRGWTALSWAVARSHKSIAIDLLEAGADCNINHNDKLTAKDLATYLPSDEMLALLEHRPANTTNSLNRGSGQAAHTAHPLESNTQSMLASGDAQPKMTDLRYGELEVFLLGLELPHLIDLCQKQLIDLNLLMTLTEQDLINAGIDQIGARKKILDAVQAVHKKDWEASSLVSVHYGKQIRCADAVAMLANSSKHLRYIASTVAYVNGQLCKHPDSVTQPTDQVTPTLFLRHTEDALKNVSALRYNLNLLKKDLQKAMSHRSIDPPDFIDSSRTKNIKRKRHQFILTAVGFVSAMALFWFLKKQRVVDYVHLNVSNIVRKVL